MIGLKGEPKRVKRQDEIGQTLILFALGLAVLLGMAAMTIDVGLAYVARRDMQNAADAAALAGADFLLEGQSSVLAANVARDLALQNGYDNAAADVTVTINIPPTSGSHSGDSDFVEVIIEHPVDFVLARALPTDKTSFDISARAVAGIDRTPKPYSIITLSQAACQAMQFNGQVNLTITDAGTLTNSECTVDAFSTNGTINVDTSANDVVGGWNITGQSGDVSLPPSRAGHYDDPLIGVPVPMPTSGPVQTCPTYGGPPGTVILQPGVYNCTIDPTGQWGLQFEPGNYYITGGIVINGGGDVTFGEGLYFLQGQGLIITGNGTVTGDDVTFYIDEGQVTLTGTSDTQLTAPTSGTYEGIVIFQNRSLTTTVNMSGDAISDGWGAVYAAGAQIHLVGNTGSTLHQFISDTFLMDGNSTITIDYFSGFLVPVPVMSLVE